MTEPATDELHEALLKLCYRHHRDLRRIDDIRAVVDPFIEAEVRKNKDLAKLMNESAALAKAETARADGLEQRLRVAGLPGGNAGEQGWTSSSESRQRIGAVLDKLGRSDSELDDDVIDSVAALVDAEKARADKWAKLANEVDKESSKRIAELTERAESAENIASQLQDQRKRIAALGAYIKAQGGNFTGPDCGE